MQAALLHFAKYFSGAAVVAPQGTLHAMPIRRMPFASEFVVPLSQHAGTPARPCVRIGQEVVRGEPIANASGFVSIAMHAPVTGNVVAIEPRPNARGEAVPSIVIRAYSGATQEVLYRISNDLAAMIPAEIVNAVQAAGIVDELVAPFPAHVKLAVPEGSSIDTLVVNCCRSGSGLSADGRLMIENADEIHRGIEIVLRALGARTAIVAVESNGSSSAEILMASQFRSGHTSTATVHDTQLGEKELLRTLLGRKMPERGIAAQTGAVIFSVSTIAQIGLLIPCGEGLTEQVVAISGPGVEHPGNYRIALGTPIRFALRQAGITENASAPVVTGSKIDIPVLDLDAPFTKSVYGIDVSTQSKRQKPENISLNLRSRVNGGRSK